MADLIGRTTITDIEHRGSHELAGSISIIVDSDAFADASPETPIFIEVALSHDARTAHTLVDQTLPGSDEAAPIYLASQILTADEDRRNVMPTDTVSIVRWVAGEPSIWLRVLRSSSHWIETSTGTVVPLDVDNSVMWRLGISARATAGIFEDAFSDGIANMPFNTRDPMAEAYADSDAVSTILCLDVSQSMLTTSGPDALVRFALNVYLADAEQSPGVFGVGTPLAVTINNDEIIAIGRAHELETATRNVEVDLPRRTGGLIRKRGSTEVRYRKPAGTTYLHVDLYPEGWWRLTLPADSPAGFDPDDRFRVREGGAVLPTTTVPVLDSAFLADGQTLYRTIDLMYEGPITSLSFSGFDALFELTITVPATAFEGGPASFSAPELAIDLYTADHGDPTDEPPYTNPWQNRWCAPSILQFSAEPIALNGFLPAAEVPVRAFTETSLTLYSWTEVVLDGNIGYF